MLTLNKVHHIAILCSDYQKSKTFYTEVLGLTIIREIYREERQSYKLDLALNGIYVVELFSFPNPPKRPSRPEAVGLRHLAFEVINLEETIANFLPDIVLLDILINYVYECHAATTRGIPGSTAHAQF